MKNIIDFFKKSIIFPQSGSVHIMDPTYAANGFLLSSLAGSRAKQWGITYGDLSTAADEEIISGSVFEVRVNPLECMGLLILVPPQGEELAYLRHTTKWLTCEGVLLLVVPEVFLKNQKANRFLTKTLKNIAIYSLSDDTIALFGNKRGKGDSIVETIIPDPPYEHYRTATVQPYYVPSTEGPKVFQSGDTVTPEDVINHTPQVIQHLKKAGILIENTVDTVRPLFPLRRGHIVAILTSGILNGLVETDDSYMVIKGFTDRKVKTEITKEGATVKKDIYQVGIRVMGPDGWYDVQ